MKEYELNELKISVGNAVQAFFNPKKSVAPNDLYQFIEIESQPIEKPLKWLEEPEASFSSPNG